MQRTTRSSTGQPPIPVTSTSNSISNRVFKPATKGKPTTKAENKSAKIAHPAVKNAAETTVPKLKQKIQSTSKTIPEPEPPAPIQVESSINIRSEGKSGLKRKTGGDRTDVVNAICQACGEKYYFDENIEGVCGDGDVHIPKVGSVGRDGGMLKVPEVTKKPKKQRVKKSEKEKKKEAVVEMVRNFKASCSTCGKKYFIAKNVDGVCGEGSHVQAWGSMSR